MANETAENAQIISSDKRIFPFEEQQKIDIHDVSRIFINNRAVFKEQQKINIHYEEDRKIFDAIKFNPNHGFMEAPKFLGLSRECTSYYIGAAWLTEDNSTEYKNAVVVNPKQISNEVETDFIEMYVRALQFAPSSEYFSKCYGIDLDQPAIECKTLNEQLTPLLIVHYLAVLKKIISHGLKKDYVIREENLRSKVRGRIMLQKNLQKNIFVQRQDRVFCRFQEYTVDTIENRLLKKALVFSDRFFNSLTSKSSSLNDLKRIISQAENAFVQVSDDIEVSQIKVLKRNKLFKEYSEAIRLAKMILRRFDYSITKTEMEQKSVPPFWIDMSRLYEIYVYSKLYEAYGDKILFQVEGWGGTAADFVKTDEKIILDAKYKTHYQDTNSPLLPDIREMSGYARDEKILKAMGINEKEEKIVPVIPCVIIYPGTEDTSFFNNNHEPVPVMDLVKNRDLVKNKKCKISGFKEFYKLCIKLPAIKH